MSRLLRRALAFSAALHAAALALVLLPGRGEDERPVIAVEVTWVSTGSALPSLPPSGLTRRPIAADVPSAHPSRREFADREIVAQDEASPAAPPHPEEPVAASVTSGISKDGPLATTVLRQELRTGPETTETARSPRRRQVVAARPPESHHPESSRFGDVPISTDLATALPRPAALDARASGAVHVREPGSAAAGSSDFVADGGEIVYRVAPTYPLAARRRGIEGAVLLHVRFDASGRPEDISVMTSSGSTMLDAAARDAVASWRFRGGVAGSLDLPFTFRLTAAPAGEASLVRPGVQQ